MDCEEKTVREKLLYEGRILSLYNDEVVLADGRKARREYVHHNGGAGILPIDCDGNVYLVEQYRYPYRQNLLEIPAGKLNPGEDAKACALRELKEEVGGISSDVEALGVVYPTPGYSDEPLYVFIARDVTIGAAKPDDGEFLNVVKMPFEKALEMTLGNEIRDGKSVVAILRHALSRG